MSLPRQKRIEHGMIWFDETLIGDADQHCFDPDYWQTQQRIVGSAQGRGTTWFIQLDSLQVALRHYRRGGLLGKLVADHYWFTGWGKTRSAQEFTLLTQLRQAGVNVPRPVAARVVRRGFTYQADLISERIEHAQDLVEVLQAAPLSQTHYHHIGAEIAKMHHAGVDHTDLNIHNILLDSHQTVWLIDFDKCAFRTGKDWQQGNLDRLKRSFIKEQHKRKIHWQEADFTALLQGYTQTVHLLS